MTSYDLQIKYKNLSDRLNNLALEKAKAEAQLDQLLEQKEKTFNDIKSIAKVETLEEAEIKLAKLQEKLTGLFAEAEALLNE